MCTYLLLNTYTPFVILELSSDWILVLSINRTNRWLCIIKIYSCSICSINNVHQCYAYHIFPTIYYFVWFHEKNVSLSCITLMSDEQELRFSWNLRITILCIRPILGWNIRLIVDFLVESINQSFDKLFYKQKMLSILFMLIQVWIIIIIMHFPTLLK